MIKYESSFFNNKAIELYKEKLPKNRILVTFAIGTFMPHKCKVNEIVEVYYPYNKVTKDVTRNKYIIRSFYKIKSVRKATIIDKIKVWLKLAFKHK